MSHKITSTVLLFLLGLATVTPSPLSDRSEYLSTTTEIGSTDLPSENTIDNQNTPAMTSLPISTDPTSEAPSKSVWNTMTGNASPVTELPAANTIDSQNTPAMTSLPISTDPTTEMSPKSVWNSVTGDASGISKSMKLTMVEEEPVFPIDVGTSCDRDLREIVFRGMACTCDVNSRYVRIRDDYKYTPGVGAHKLHTAGANFNTARRICNEEGAHLVVINSLKEEQVLIDMFKAADVNSFVHVVSTGEARVGLHDLYKEGDWVTVLGDSVAKTGYNKWGVTIEGVKQPDNAGGEHCAVLMIHEDGNGLNDVKCQMAYPFFCEISEDNIY